MSMKRNDPYSPKNMNPKDFTILAFGYKEMYECPITGYMESMLVFEEMSPRWTEMGCPQEPTWDKHKDGTCDHCGHYVKYFSVLINDKTQEIIQVGCKCLERFMDLSWKFDTKALKTRAENNLREITWLANHPKEAMAYQYCKMAPQVWEVAKDIARKVRQYGDLSEKQLQVIVNAYEKYKESLIPKPDVITTPCPQGKMVIEGTILSVKSVDGYFGATTLKMLVEDDRGFKVYGTTPDVILGQEGGLRGRKVRFNASVEPSEKDNCFGYYKRPTKAQLL
jgi:hypothetical protein